jgi:hypothetical protein
MGKSTWVAGALAVSAFAADHLLDDVAPKLPHAVAVVLFAASLVVLGGARIGRVWSFLLGRMPRPWLPFKPWRAPRWLKERPGAAILLAQPRIQLDSGCANCLSFTLTISRGFMRASAPTRMLFADSELVLRQGRRRIILRPQEAGGFLALAVQPGGHDAVMLDFVDPACPRAIADVPDFNGGYTLELRGVRAEIGDNIPLSGILPPARWEWAGSAAWSRAPADASELQAAF